jgi:predicted Fe-S protein YdhL (DUF1289 family)
MFDSDAVWKRDEITQWSRMNPVDRHRIMAELPDRKGLVMKRRGGIHKRKERA